MLTSDPFPRHINPGGKKGSANVALSTPTGDMGEPHRVSMLYIPMQSTAEPRQHCRWWHNILSGVGHGDNGRQRYVQIVCSSRIIIKMVSLTLCRCQPLEVFGDPGPGDINLMGDRSTPLYLTIQLPAKSSFYPKRMKCDVSSPPIYSCTLSS